MLNKQRLLWFPRDVISKCQNGKWKSNYNCKCFLH